MCVTVPARLAESLTRSRAMGISPEKYGGIIIKCGQYEPQHAFITSYTIGEHQAKHDILPARTATG